MRDAVLDDFNGQALRIADGLLARGSVTHHSGISRASAIQRPSSSRSSSMERVTIGSYRVVCRKRLRASVHPPAHRQTTGGYAWRGDFGRRVQRGIACGVPVYRGDIDPALLGCRKRPAQNRRSRARGRMARRTGLSAIMPRATFRFG
jgi:hypothetical protein